MFRVQEIIFDEKSLPFENKILLASVAIRTWSLQTSRNGHETVRNGHETVRNGHETVRNVERL